MPGLSYSGLSLVEPLLSVNMALPCDHLHSLVSGCYSADIQLSEPVGIADSLSNLSLVKTFCGQRLPKDIYHFTTEDLLYASDTIKPSLLAFLSQLLDYFVLSPIDIVRPLRVAPANTSSSSSRPGEEGVGVELVLLPTS